ncbi:MAG: hypothetical protein OHK0046_20170 [Anaerolineae bacterium]
MTMDWVFACPCCGAVLEAVSANQLHCPREKMDYYQEFGIWRLLPPERTAHYHQFMHEYQTIRDAEGRGAQHPAWYRALPFEDNSGRFTEDWRIRAESYRTLMEKVIAPSNKPLRVLDVGAGNGWLSNRLAENGHRVAAVDLLVNATDGLGAHKHYSTPFTPVQAEFDHLPFADSQADVVIFNGALHYSTNYHITLNEALRVASQIVIMDSPVYHDATSGQRMVQEREAHFEKMVGFRSNTLPSESFLTYARLEALANELGLTWRRYTPNYGLKWNSRSLRARLRGHREPAKFHVLVGERVS